ncbi:glutamyl-tRNA(Gln) amidotransferase subunit B, mitochondrial [Gadus chalcogrammus]|uniref:glutamyl-tRNA(Gln) amidotransferase subunit B, mitochondrial n=1 Tax=Gadus chalcogrammus TaxID=1042646 RepID=UPI0024C30629|nr:glutamyl-tRNA(Gln) amidotransferase subunit B, mitochondrial [Gadus chalcogrammus]
MVLLVLRLQLLYRSYLTSLTIPKMATNGDAVNGHNDDLSTLSNGVALIDRLRIRPTLTNGAGGDEKFTFSKEPTLEEVRRLQAEFTDERDWNQFHQPRNLLLALVGEVGEVSELFQWRGEVAEGLPGWTDSEREHLGQELSDVLIYLVELAEKCHVDLPQAVLRKMALNRLKYPASKVQGSSKKYTEYTD